MFAFMKQEITDLMYVKELTFLWFFMLIHVGLIKIPTLQVLHKASNINV
jgi:hypothetical protein